MSEKLQNSYSAAVSSPVAREEANPWLETLATIFSSAETDLVKRALEFSRPLYAGKSMSTAEPLIQHIWGVASVLALSRVGAETLAAGLLHAVPDSMDGYVVKVYAAFDPTVSCSGVGCDRLT